MIPVSKLKRPRLMIGYKIPTPIQLISTVVLEAHPNIYGLPWDVPDALPKTHILRMRKRQLFRRIKATMIFLILVEKLHEQVNAANDIQRREADTSTNRLHITNLLWKIFRISPTNYI
ncbi:hypothetical protein PsorP6_001308 [Peronosclerospora sorghi]|uniref:Uncharacterized protein n=1 Tax=Peronosclerospora sorghi TaxID=230839 RepID=A0ACC0WUC3_9STRA|nr:hypothetical protein PsorP6_001308 [Peronosclerospora sorghi]